MNIVVKTCAPLAQLAEQLTLNQWARGSNPRRCTIVIQRLTEISGKSFFMPKRAKWDIYEKSKMSKSNLSKYEGQIIIVSELNFYKKYALIRP